MANLTQNIFKMLIIYMQKSNRESNIQHKQAIHKRINISKKPRKKMANLTQNIFKNTYNLYAKKVTENGEKIL